MTHMCHWPKCTTEVPPALWGCKRHWYKLPHSIRTEIWRCYRPGQEVDKKPSAEYIAIAEKAQAWIAANYPGFV